MIYITCGHEKSIALEILFKGLQELSVDQMSLFCLLVDHSTLLDNLQACQLSYVLKENILLFPQTGHQLSIQFTSKKNFTPTLSSLLAALNQIKPSDILLTLPSSKDQFYWNDRQHLGYTEFLRTYFTNHNLAMFFWSPKDSMLLITDHIPLYDVPKTITEELIFLKTKTCLDSAIKYFMPYTEVIFAGINPHAGEGGILGSEDQCIKIAISKLQDLYPKISFKGPLSADTIYLDFLSPNPKRLTVFMYHDQGLGVFKFRNQINGLNITLGLPFLRISVDHGTALDLFGKNQADASGCTLMLKTAHKISTGLKYA